MAPHSLPSTVGPAGPRPPDLATLRLCEGEKEGHQQGRHHGEYLMPVPVPTDLPGI